MENKKNNLVQLGDRYYNVEDIYSILDVRGAKYYTDETLNNNTTEEESKIFFEELVSINGIGKKTAEKIMRIYKSRQDIIDNLDNLPFDNNDNKFLIDFYGDKYD